MVATSIELVGAKELRAKLQSMTADVRKAASDAVVGSAVELRADVVKSIHRWPASGRIYTKYNPSRTHQASAPGQAPMTDTGRLANSVFFDKVGDLTAVVGSNLIYALYLEHGTTQMAARPFFRPAVERMRPKFNKRLEAAIRGATQ